MLVLQLNVQSETRNGSQEYLIPLLFVAVWSPVHRRSLRRSPVCCQHLLCLSPWQWVSAPPFSGRLSLFLASSRSSSSQRSQIWSVIWIHVGFDTCDSGGFQAKTYATLINFLGVHPEDGLSSKKQLKGSWIVNYYKLLRHNKKYTVKLVKFQVKG